MLAFTTTEILLLLIIISGGAASTDLAALVQPSHYFKSRHLEPTLDRMVDFAITEPKTPKLQIRQLTALRHLADEAGPSKKAAKQTRQRSARLRTGVRQALTGPALR